MLVAPLPFDTRSLLHFLLSQTMSKTTATLAQQALSELIGNVRNQTPQTLAVWRLSSAPLVQALEDFAAKTGGNSNNLLERTQQLFDRINSLLAAQEQLENSPFAPSCSLPNNETPKNEISVVFGGKYGATTPRSISERLVSNLVEDSLCVTTVSRSELSYELPSNVTHIVKRNLDTPIEGEQEFVNVLSRAQDQWQQLNSETTTSSTLVLYFTLGQHKGENPFVRNLTAARNFGQALQQCLSSSALLSSSPPSWRVVLTGTDATLPSTWEDSEFEWKHSSTATSQCLVIPSYKIMKYNYIYAMSKLGQYYLVANAVAKLTNRPDIVAQTAPVIAKIQRQVEEAGEDGTYHPPEKAEEESLISMDELDEISRSIESIEASLQTHFSIAKGISICYTPLHAKPWTEQAKATDDPVSYVLEQIVKRLKNAISIDRAVECHLRR